MPACPQGSLGFELVEESDIPFLIREHGEDHSRDHSPALNITN